MNCPFCAHPDDKVVDSRPVREGSAIRRRRECLNCKRRFTTYEYVELALKVRKGDGRREDFSREKLRRGVELAVVKRPVSGEQVERLVAEVEEACQKLGGGEVNAEQIGELVMARLRELDEIAYIRFASVYRRFQDVGEFKQELDKL